MGFDEQLASRLEPLAALVPYTAIRHLAIQPAVLDEMVWKRFAAFGSKPHQYILEIGPAASPVWFLYADLPWDSEFFQLQMARLHAVLFIKSISPTELATAVACFTKVLANRLIDHCYCEVAAKDPQLLYALGRAGWSVVENRLQYYHDALDKLESPRQAVRTARHDEADLVRTISAENRNLFDRFHADPIFSSQQADAFLGEYAAAAVQGYCDIVLMPDEIVPDSFLGISYISADAQLLSIKMGRVVLTAVGPQNRGWHRKLLSETLWHTRERGGEAVLMTTQATNGAVIHNAWQLGFQLGELTHIVSIQPKAYAI